MPFNKSSQKKAGAVVLLFVFTFWISFSALFGMARPARAQYVDPVTSIQTTMTNIWSKLSDAMVEGVSVALANAANYFLSQLAYQIAVGIVSGCPGQKPCTVTSFLGDAVANAGKGALGEAIGSLSKAGGFEALGINLCAPPSANFGLSIQLGLLDEAKPPAPKCDFNQVMSNWESAAKSLSPDELKKNLWQGFKPGSQPLSMSLHATQTIKTDIFYEKDKKLSEQLAKLSGTGGFEAVTDPVTKQVRTPAAAVKAEFERGEREKNEYPKIFQQIQNAGQTARGSVWGAILMNAAQTFGQTLLAQAWNKLVNKLFASQESPEAEVVPELLATEEGIQTVGATEQAAALSPKFSSPPLTEVGVIDPLAQFSVCTPTSRTPWNCTADTQMAAAVRLGSTKALTVGEAVKQGYLHGDWELIPDTDRARNSTGQCFSSAYCESNLKKLRAARILPIGWEIAASLGTAEKRYTLNEALDNFHDSSHPLYHLVDPGWVLKQPLTQCKTQVFGQFLVSSEIPRRSEVCVDAPTCLREDDFGQCIGGYGYCTRERNVWRFNGDSCPKEFNTCRTLTARVGNKKVNYIANTIDRSVCNASNVGCKAYAIKLNSFSCTMAAGTPGFDGVTQTCTQTGGCDCVSKATCQVNQNDRTCINSRQEICTLPESSCTSGSPTWGLTTASKCDCSISYSCKVQVGSRTCSTVAGNEQEKGDDWLETPTKYFNKAVATCSVDKNGCSSLIKFEGDEALNLVRNGSFEETEDGDSDGEPDHAKYWSPFGSVSPSGAGATIRDAALVIDGTSSLRVGPSGTAIQTTCTDNSCVSERGCDCISGANKCRVYKGSGTCTITNRVVQDRIPVSASKTYTLSAVFKSESAGNSARMNLKFKAADGSAYITFAAGGITTKSGDAAYTCNMVSGGVELAVPNAIFDPTTKLARVSCAFMVNVPVSSAALEIVGANTLVDNVMLVEGSSTAFHEAYSTATNTVYVKVPPKYLGCTGEDSDRQECASFAAVCRENELGCNLYNPSSGEPAIPGVTSPKDRCPSACVGYDVFKQGATDFERQEKFPVYFIPRTATVCTEQENGCSEFTDIITEEVAYYSQIRLCQLPDAADNQVFYSWEGSDTAGYQLKVWNLKRTDVNINDSSADADASRRSDLAVSGVAGSSTGTAPCTKLDTTPPLNAFGTPKCVNMPANREGLCSRSDIDAGNFDCREFYDEFGNKHYRLLSRTMLGTADCRRYRITVSTQQDCNDSNGTWDNAKKECVYLASLVDSYACAKQANGCRAYKGNTATSVRALFTDDFEAGKGGWDIRLTDYGSPSVSTLSPESVSVGGHSLKIASGNPSAFRDVTQYVAANRAYSISFWARGSGKLSINFADYAGGSSLTCSVNDCAGSNCRTCVHSTGLTCQNPIADPVEGSDWSCGIKKRSEFVPSTPTPAYIPFSDLTGGNKCSNALGTSCLTDANCTGGGRCIRVQVVNLTSEWKQYAVGPVIIGDPYFGQAPVGIKIDTQGTSDVFIDKFVLKESKDNIYVVRDSWKTPLVCDQTPDGQSSPLEMLGCREYTDKDDQKVTLRSFTKLCREKSVGCAAYSVLQETPQNPYEDSYNAVCKLTSVCAPTGGQANCVCNYNLDHYAASSAASSPVLFDVCRVAINETECRFNLEGQDNFANRSTHRDIISIPADERQYLVATKQVSCNAKDSGCRTFGQANVVYEGVCSIAPGLACQSGASSMKVCAGGAKKDQACSTNANCPDSVCSNAKLCASGLNEGFVCTVNGDCPGSTCTADIFNTARQICTCTDRKTGGKCEIPAGQASCKFSPEKGVISDWKAAAFKDDPSAYTQTLCLEKEVGCEQYTAADGAWYFKDPGNKACVYKENVAVEGRQRSGWFRKTDAGLFACYPELVKDGNYFEMYRNRDATCTRAGKCTEGDGCPCPNATAPVCVVALGKTECGYTGWVGQCDSKYNMCEEFIDPLATSASHPAGQPYYYIVNGKLDKSSCAGTVNLKQGCVLFKQTSNPADDYSAGATYLKAIREVGNLSGSTAGVTPENCDLTNRNTNYCNQRCFSYLNGYCHKGCTTNAQCPGGTCRANGSCSNYADQGKECFQDSGTYGCAAGGVCKGKKQYGSGCSSADPANPDKDCNAAIHEKCISEPGAARTFTANDTNLILKVRQDRECGQWLTCSQSSTTWDDNSKKWRSTCTDFTACEEFSQVGDSTECVKYVDPPKKILSVNKNTANNFVNYEDRDVTWAGLDYSGYSIYNKYPLQYTQPLRSTDPNVGFCVATGTEDGKQCDIRNNHSDCAGGAGVCTTNPFVIQRFGIVDNTKANLQKCAGGKCVKYCDSNSNCLTDGAGTGTCFEHNCYYALTGGPVDFANLKNAPSCRAYPEADAPFGPSVLTDGAAGGYDNTTLVAKNISTDYKGANICMKGQYCECGYKRITYGRNQGTRYVSLRSGADDSTDVPVGICSGGDYDGVPCDNTAACSPGGTTEPEKNGRCVMQSSIMAARGWPGFCVDYDLSMNVGNDPRQYGCNLWLPVDQLSGMPSQSNQFSTAGIPTTAGVNKLSYCTVAEGGRVGEVSERADGYYDQINGGSDNPDNAFEATDGCCIDDNDDYGLNNYPLTSAKSGTDIQSDFNRGYARKKRVELFVVNTNGSSDNNNSNKKCSTGDCNFVLHRGNNWTVDVDWNGLPDAGGWFDSDQNGFCHTLLYADDDDDDGTGGTNESSGSRYDANNRWWVGDNAPNDVNCLGARVLWSDNTENAYPVAIRTAFAHGSTNMDDVYYDADFHVYYRESCNELVDVYNSSVMSAEVLPAVESHKYWDMQKNGATVNGFPWSTYYSHSSTRPGLPSSGSMEPLGRLSPWNLDVIAFGNNNRWPVPIYESEFGAPREPGSPAASVLPLACSSGYCSGPPGAGSGLTAGRTTLKTLFAKSFGAYIFDYTTNTYGNSASMVYDERATRSSGKQPRVVTVTDLCYDDNGMLLCQEGSAGLTVNGLRDADIRSDLEAARLKVSIKYYAYADKDHMPIIRKVVDFGDGSMVDDTYGYFKNHRGGSDAGGGKLNSLCTGAEWGLTTESCEPRYFEETKTYTCSLQQYATLTSCDGVGSATEHYPCAEGGACVFRPRVQITDNWGICNGNCPGGLAGSQCMNNNIYTPTWTDAAGDECVAAFDSAKAAGKEPWTWYGARIFVFPPLE